MIFYRTLVFIANSQDHFKLQDHNCPSLKDPSMDIRVPVCPICDKPVPIKRGDDPNIRMNQHIQSNCSDLEPKNDSKCRKKGCTTKMLVPMLCTECGLSFCVKHRLEVDHQCQGKPAKPTPLIKKTLFSSSNNSSNKQPQTSRLEMERQRRERANAANQRNQDIARLQAKAKQGKITDNEQIQLAKLLSLKDKDGKCIVC
ncbi:hypothetical protein [Parasitella parasitica]|uniref:AN1-type domain-containing protein n=1 Tax=Parasitella parasitica TaxID=35722 RepID=A0A0B7NFH3_9FUNG|nr:hypothetical protein [Parasitella parasitica]